MDVLCILIRRNRLWVMAAVVAAFLSNLSQMLYMLRVGELVNKIEGREKIEGTFIVILGAFLVSNAITLFFNQYIGRMTAEKMAHSLRMGYARRLVEKAASDRENSDPAAAMSVAQNELAQADAYLGNTFFDITGMLLTGILVMAFLLFQNVWLTFIFLLPTVLILLYVLWSGQKLGGLISAAQEEKRRLNRVAYSTVHAFPVIRIFAGDKQCCTVFDQRLSGWREQATRLGRMNALYNTLSGVLSRVPLLLLLAVGTFMVIDGQIRLGTLIVFLNLQKSLTQTVMNLPSWISGFKIFTTNLSRIKVL